LRGKERRKENFRKKKEGELMMKKMEKLAYSDHRKIVTKESMMRIDVTLNLSMPAVVASSVHLDTFLAAGSKKPNNEKEDILSHSPLPERGISNNFIVHQFISCAHQAFDQHIGFVLAPQQLFLLILQQIALHVNQNAKELRAQFVRHEGKKDLAVDVPMNPTAEQWAGAMQSIQQQIGENTVPDTLQLFSLQEFSTIIENEKVAGRIALMDTVKSSSLTDVELSVEFPFSYWKAPSKIGSRFERKQNKLLFGKLFQISVLGGYQHCFPLWIR
jgi:hypothetical protein